MGALLAGVPKVRGCRGSDNPVLPESPKVSDNPRLPRESPRVTITPEGPDSPVFPESPKGPDNPPESPRVSGCPVLEYVFGVVVTTHTPRTRGRGGISRHHHTKHIL